MSPLLKARRALFVLVGAATVTGCYTYHPVTTVPVGSTVRVRVPVQSALNNPNRAPESASIEGLVIQGGDTISLATETRRQLGAYREIVQFDTIRLAQSQTSSIEVLEFSSSRSVILGLAIAGGAGTLAAVAFGLGGGGEGSTPDGGGPETAVVSMSMVSALWGLITR